MRHSLIEAWRADIVGVWQPELCGVDLLHLKPAAGQFDKPLTVRGDGTWAWPSPTNKSPTDFPPPEWWSWGLADDRMLSLWTPVAPKPAYGLPDWSHEEKPWLVLAVADQCLALSEGHQTIVFRRVDRDEYDRRKAAEYRQMLGEVRQRIAGSRPPPPAEQA
ncbi:hypothetical protein [Fimbriiglobus ruber]|uniref:Uncharacterized protein n=1 Tax=Fimbriiglobus ruber TaxID=1908690 RepID=A0A225E8R8_9BACT|nr:hypothetical protein [Fimbriiglobus ruber]OWK47158.1 hypothetical protein FRUB_00857 [Fimbriiglobus ruber]